MTQIRNINLHDGSGNPIGSLSGALNIHDADVHTKIVNSQFSQTTATTTTFAAIATAGSTSITLTSATGFAIGSYLDIYNATQEELTKIQIINLVGSVVTLDRPLDFTYAIGDNIDKSLVNMNVIGTLASPQAFHVQPFGSDVWHLKRILIEMTHSSAGDNGLFGNITALTNGVVLRRYDGTTGVTSTFTNWKTNGDIVTDVYDVTYAARSGGS